MYDEWIVIVHRPRLDNSTTHTFETQAAAEAKRDEALAEGHNVSMTHRFWRHVTEPVGFWRAPQPAEF